MENKYFKIKWFRFILRLIFNRGNRYWLSMTIEYALRYHWHRRGDGSSSVLLFMEHFSDCLKNLPKDEE